MSPEAFYLSVCKVIKLNQYRLNCWQVGSILTVVIILLHDVCNCALPLKCSVSRKRSKRYFGNLFMTNRPSFLKACLHVEIPSEYPGLFGYL